MSDFLHDKLDDLPEEERRRLYEEYVRRNEEARRRPAPAYARGAMAGALLGAAVTKAAKEVHTGLQFLNKAKKSAFPIPNFVPPYRYSMPIGALVGMGATAWGRRNKKTASLAESRFFYVNPKELEGEDTTVEDLMTLPLSAQARRDIIANKILIKSNPKAPVGARSPGGGYIVVGGDLPPGPRAAAIAHEVAHYKNRDFSKLILRKLAVPLATGLAGYAVGSKIKTDDPVESSAFRTIGSAAGAFLGNKLVNLYDSEIVDPRADEYAARHAGSKNLEDAILATSNGKMTQAPKSGLVRAAQRVYTGLKFRHQPAWKRIQTLRNRDARF